MPKSINIDPREVRSVGTLKFADIPVRYAERTYGRTNIRRWRDGWKLARMLLVVARRLKWV